MRLVTAEQRVQSVVNELDGEKIDVIPWSDEPEELIANVLSPAKVEDVFIVPIAMKKRLHL